MLPEPLGCRVVTRVTRDFQAAMRTIASFACTRVAEFGTQEKKAARFGLAAPSTKGGGYIV